MKHKHNRKISKRMSVMAGTTIRFGSIIIMLFVMVIVYLLASSSCQQLLKGIGEKERLLGRLEDERTRETARWEEMKTNEQLERTLFRHGLKLSYAKPDQVVRMRRDGIPYGGQRSVAKARARRQGMAAEYRHKTNR